jgi:hypothetical protein
VSLILNEMMYETYLLPVSPGPNNNTFTHLFPVTETGADCRCIDLGLLLVFISGLALVSEKQVPIFQLLLFSSFPVAVEDGGPVNNVTFTIFRLFAMLVTKCLAECKDTALFVLELFLSLSLCVSV